MPQKPLLTVTAVLAIGALAACGKSNAEDNKKPAKAARVASTSAPVKPAPTATDKPSSLAAAGGDYEIDAIHSQVIFRLAHFGVSHQYGRFNKVTGSLTIDGRDPSKSRATVDIAAGSVFTADMKRDKHLKGPDFFDVKQFPSIKFTSTSVAAAGEGSYKVTGDLALHGVTKPVTIELDHIGSGKDPYGGYRSGFEGTFTIKRSDFGMSFMLEGIGDEVRLIVAIEAVRK